MLSYQVTEFSKPLARVAQETPRPTGRQVLIRTTAAGVCHSDLHIWDGYYDLGGGKKLTLGDRGIKLPLTMGHEIVGEVAAVGPEVTGVKVGDTRMVFPWIGCGVCAPCKADEENLCLSMRFRALSRSRSSCCAHSTGTTWLPRAISSVCGVFIF